MNNNKVKDFAYIMERLTMETIIMKAQLGTKPNAHMA
jgi:hypothetical protein